MDDFDFGVDEDNLTREERTVEELMELPVYDERDINDSPKEFFHREYIFTAGRNKFDFIMDVCEKCGYIPIYTPVQNGYDMMVIRLVRIVHSRRWANSKEGGS